MKEFAVDLVIDKTYIVHANTLDEAKEKAIINLRKIMSDYSSLCIDNVELLDDNSKKQYEVTLIKKEVYCIDADNEDEAIEVASEYCNNDKNAWTEDIDNVEVRRINRLD